MKNRFASLSAIFLLGAFLTFTGCADPCKDVECNNGTCVDGGCQCNVGYEGIVCLERMTEKFVGSYDAVDTCNLGNFPTYTIDITQSTQNITELRIDNLYDVNSQGVTTQIIATVDTADSDHFMFSDQNLGGNIFDGHGMLDEATNTIEIVFTIDDAATDSCRTVLVLQ